MTDDMLEQLAAHRRTLAHLLGQRAKFSAGFVPAHVANGIADVRTAIAQLKAQLRAAAIAVDDEPGDEARPGAETFTPTAVDPLAAAQVLLARMPTEDAASLPEVTSLPTPHRMPLARNPLFVGRDSQLKAIAQTLKNPHGAAAIGQVAAATGIGGVGKTNLATEFVHRYGAYFAGGVFWLSFADPAGIAPEIAACGASGIVQHVTWHELPLDEQVVLVRQAWEAPVPRLLIFDNCEEEELVRIWRPTTGGCRILLTSRRERWSAALGIVPQPLDVLPRSESIRLLHSHRPDRQPTDPVLDTIAGELGDLPLALHLAGSYLETNTDDPSIFLHELRSRPLLEHEALQGIDTTYSPTNHLLHVGRTFSLSYQHLNPNQPTDQLARDLLAYAVCLAPGEPIPRELLIAITIEDPNDSTQRRNAGRAIERARAVGLIESVGGQAFKIHRLVRWFIEQVSDRQSALQRAERGILHYARALQADPTTDTILACQPHFRWLADIALEQRRENARYLCVEIGLCLNAISAYSIAQHYFEQALALLQA